MKFLSIFLLASLLSCPSWGQAQYSYPLAKPEKQFFVSFGPNFPSYSLNRFQDGQKTSFKEKLRNLVGARFYNDGIYKRSPDIIFKAGLSIPLETDGFTFQPAVFVNFDSDVAKGIRLYVREPFREETNTRFLFTSSSIGIQPALGYRSSLNKKIYFAGNLGASIDYEFHRNIFVFGNLSDRGLERKRYEGRYFIGNGASLSLFAAAGVGIALEGADLLIQPFVHSQVITFESRTGNEFDYGFLYRNVGINFTFLVPLSKLAF